jgi:hypothetical protein
MAAGERALRDSAGALASVAAAPLEVSENSAPGGGVRKVLSWRCQKSYHRDKWLTPTARAGVPEKLPRIGP